MERTGTGALIDAIGIRGRTIRTWKYWDQTLFADMMDTLDPNIVVIAYGTNEASDPDYSMEQYRTDLRKNLTMLQKSRPDQACILVGPSDRGKSKGKRSFYVWSQTARVASVQREVAPEFGCVFWDWQQAQGGEGAMIAWRYTNPPLAAKDLLHHTPQGYVHMAEQFIKALDDAAQHYR
jgi:lysophospholipase L1-like esterase